jgi:hypothetical protein
MKTKFSLPGFIIGIIAFVVAVLHFWLGPIEKVSIEDLAVQKVHKIKQALSNSLSGNGNVHNDTKIGPDKIVNVAVITIALAGLILGMVGFVKKENIRYCLSSIAISGVTIALHYILAALGAILIVVVIIAVLSKFDFT